MTRILRFALLVFSVVSVAALAHAQSGCVNSPENPTALLALVGIAGSAVPWLRSKVAKKK